MEGGRLKAGAEPQASKTPKLWGGDRHWCDQLLLRLAPVPATLPAPAAPTGCAPGPWPCLPPCSPPPCCACWTLLEG